MASVGDITMDAHIDGSKLPSELRRAAEAASKGVKIEVPADLDEKGLATKVKATAEAVSKFAEVEFEADLNSKKLRAEVAALKRTLGEGINIGNAPTELRSAWAKAAAAAKKATEAKDVRIKASLDFTESEAALAQYRARRLFMQKPIKVPVELGLEDRGKVLLQIQALKRTLTENNEILFNIDLDEASLSRGRLRGIVKKRMQEQLDELRQQHVEITAQVEVDLAKARTQLAGLKDVELGVDLDAAAAKIEFEKVKAELSADRGIELQLKADPDLISARLASDKLRAAINDRAITIPIRVRTEKDLDSSAWDRLKAGILGVVGALGRYFTVRNQGANQKTKDPIGDLFKAAGTIGKFVLAQAGLVAAGVIAALPYVKALAVAAGQLVLELLAAASALGVFAAAGLGAIGAAAATAAIGMIGLSDSFAAMGKLWTAQAQGIKATKKETEAYENSLKALTPSARDFVVAINDLYPALRKVQQGVQEALFRGLGDSVRELSTTALPALQAGFIGIADVLNGLARSTADWLSSAKGVSTINAVFAILKGTLADLGQAGGNFATGFLTLFAGSKDTIDRLGTGLVGLSERFTKWADTVTKDGSWSKWLKSGEDALGDLGRIVKGVKDVAVGFWSAITGDGKKSPEVLTNLADDVEKLGKWFRDPKNAEAIKKWAEDADRNLRSLAKSIKEIVGGIDKISGWIDKINLKLGGEDRIIENPLEEWGHQIHDFLANQDWGDIDWIAIVGNLFAPFPAAVVNFFQTTEIDWVAVVGNLLAPFPTAVYDFLTTTEIDWQGIWTAITTTAAGIDWIAIVANLLAPFPAAVFNYLSTAQIDWQGIWNSLVLTAAGIDWIAIVGNLLAPFPAAVFNYLSTTQIDWQGIWSAITSTAASIDWVGIVGTLLAPFPTAVFNYLSSQGGSFVAGLNAFFLGGPAAARVVVLQIIGAFAGLAQRALARAGDLGLQIIAWGQGALRAAQTVANNIVEAFRGLAGRIVTAIGTIVPNISIPDVGVGAHGVVGAARGIAVTQGPMFRMIGEAGPEAVVPLTRSQPLDPAVRSLLRTIAADRGLDGSTAKPKEALNSSIQPQISVMLPTGDPEAAAMAVWNRLVFEGVV